MYEAFYGLKEKPFSMLPDPGFLFLSKKHKTALTLLEYGLLNHVGFCVISGEAGAGKTTVLRALLDRVDSNVTVGLITNTHQSFGGLLDWILSVFDLHKPNLTHVEMHQILMDFLIEEYANNHSVLLIVDEAQNMKADALEELRMLSNVNSKKDQLLQVVLAGQPGLKDTLRKPELMQFAQRIAIDYHLAPLNLEEACGYIQHRLVTAGAERDIFTPAACERIYNYSGGTPRLINLLCETVMVYGFADEVDVIDVALVDEMVQERMKDSVVPILNRDIAKNKGKEESELNIENFPWIKPKGATKDLKADEAVVEKAPSEEVVASFEETEAKKVAIKPVPQDPSTDDISLPVKTTVEAENAVVIPDIAPPVKKVEEGEVKQQNDVWRRGENKAPIPSQAEQEKSIPSKTYSDADKNIHTERRVNVEQNKKGGKIVKYAALLGLLILLFLIVVFLIDNKGYKDIAGLKEEAVLLLKQREQESSELEKLQTQATALKKERDAAIEKVDEEKKSKTEALKLATERAALEKQKRAFDEKKRKAETQERKRQMQQAEARAKREAERKAAVYEEERLQMQARLDEEVRLKNQKEEALRLELQRQEQQMQLQLQLQEALQEAEKKTQQPATEKKPEAKKSINTEICSGPTARFKSNCR